MLSTLYKRFLKEILIGIVSGTLGLASSAHSQELRSTAPQCLHGNPSVNLEPNQGNPISGVFAEDYNSEQIIEDVLEFIGLKAPIFYEEYKDSQNACAELSRDLVRRIYVDEDWLNEFSGGDYWVKFFWISHEIGHHLNAHAIGFNPQKKWKYENDADWFAGRVFKLAEGNWSSLTNFFEECPLKEDAAHPPCYQRAATVEQAYTGEFAVAALPRTAAIGNQPSPSTRTKSKLPVSFKQVNTENVTLINSANINSLETTPKDNVRYDVVLQPGHFGRTKGSTGGQGELVSEQHLAAFVTRAVDAKLKEIGLNSIVVDADYRPIEPISATIFLSVHADASMKPCTLGPSFGYEGGSSLEVRNLVAAAMSTALNYKVTDFIVDNFTASLSRYYFYNLVRNTKFSGTVQLGEITCPDQERNMINNVGYLIDDLARALTFAIDPELKVPPSPNTKTALGRRIDPRGCLLNSFGEIVPGFRSDCIPL